MTSSLDSVSQSVEGDQENQADSSLSSSPGSSSEYSDEQLVEHTKSFQHWLERQKESSWRHKRFWLDLLKLRWKLVLFASILSVAAALLGTFALELNDMKQYQEDDVWYSKFVISTDIATAGGLNVGPKPYTTVFANQSLSKSSIVIQNFEWNETSSTASILTTIELQASFNYSLDNITTIFATAVSNNPTLFGPGTSLQADWSITNTTPKTGDPADTYTSKDAWLVLYVVILMMCLLHGQMSPDASIMLALLILILSGVITVSESLTGFGNEGIATVGVLFVVARGITNSGVLSLLMNYILGRPNNERFALLRLSVVALHGFFITNTSFVTIMIPIVQRSVSVFTSGRLPNLLCFLSSSLSSWARLIQKPRSRFLIPLSYMSILGGTLTLIGTFFSLMINGRLNSRFNFSLKHLKYLCLGTSTNLVVAALAQAKDDSIEFPILEICKVGAPTMIVGLVYVIIFAPWLLPTRSTAAEAYEASPKQYTVSCKVDSHCYPFSFNPQVSKSSVVAGKTIAEAGLRGLASLFLVEIQRPKKETTIPAPGPDTKLRKGDILVFAGDVRGVNDLWAVEGIEPNLDGQESKLQMTGRVGSAERQLVEAVVASGSPLVGKSVREFGFRSFFNAVILAVHRQGERLTCKAGDVVLAPGDTLLLECGEWFRTNFGQSRYFTLVSFAAESGRPVRKHPFWLVSATLLTLSMVCVAAVTSSGITFFTAALCVAYLMWLIGLLTLDQARESIPLGIMVMIAAALGLSTAMSNSGLSKAIALKLIELFKPLGDLGLMFGIYAAVAVLNAFISNKASVSLVFPFAYEIALESDTISVRSMCYLLMLAGSADFSTPIGYPTNLMVYPLGGYHFLDFVRLGVPLQVICCLVSTPLCYYLFSESTGSSSAL